MPRGGPRPVPPRRDPIANTNAFKHGCSSPGGAFPLSEAERGPGAVLSLTKEGEVRLSPLPTRPRPRTIKESGTVRS